MCEEKQSMEMTRLGGDFWESGPEAVEKGVRDISKEEQEVEEEEWEKEVVGALEGLKSVGVIEGFVLSLILGIGIGIGAKALVLGRQQIMRSISRNCISF